MFFEKCLSKLGDVRGCAVPMWPGVGQTSPNRPWLLYSSPQGSIRHSADVALCAMDGIAASLVAMVAYDTEIHFCLQELLSRTSLETQKLDLMTEVSELKLKLVGMEKEQREQEEKQRKAEVSVVHPVRVGWGWGLCCTRLLGCRASCSPSRRWVPGIFMHWRHNDLFNTKLSGFAVAAHFSNAQTTQFWL